MLADHRYDLDFPPDASVGVVVLHPHPDMGGDRFNPVVDAVYRAATGRGWAAVRFDFSSSDPELATAETVAALDLLSPVAHVVVVGYSFGAAIAARIDDQRVSAWAMIAPPFGPRFPGEGLPVGADPRPKLLLAPAHDQFCPPEAAALATSTWVNTSVEPVASADHFLAGFVDAVAARALDWLAPPAG